MEVGLCKVIHCRIVLQAWGESGDLCETSVCNPFLTLLLAQPTPSWPLRLLRASLGPLWLWIHRGRWAKPELGPSLAEGREQSLGEGVTASSSQ